MVWQWHLQESDCSIINRLFLANILSKHKKQENSIEKYKIILYKMCKIKRINDNSW